MGAVESTPLKACFKGAPSGEPPPLTKVSELLQYKYKRARQDTSRNGALQQAAAQGDAQALEALIQLLVQHAAALPGPTTSVLDATNSKGQTALHCAASCGQTECVQLLLSQGADPWIKDRHTHRLAIHFAAMNGHAGSVRALLDTLGNQRDVISGVRHVDAPSLSGFSPLHYAVASGSLETVSAVLEFEPNLVCENMWDAYEYGLDVPPRSTPLHIAAARGTGAIALALLRYYAERAEARLCPDPRLPRDGLSRAPWQIAHAAKNMYLSRLLNPLLSLDHVFSPEELAPVGVPTLAFLAAAAHKAGMLSSIQQCSGRRIPTSLKDPAAAQGLKHNMSAEVDIVASPSRSSSSELSSASTDLSVSQSPHSACELHQAAGSASDEEDGDGGMDDEEAVCDICFASRVHVRPVGCQHALCRGCALTLVQAMKKDCVKCPFCRQDIAAFVVAAPAPSL